MTTDAFSEQRLPDQPLKFDRTRTAVIVVDMVNEFFEPGGKMVLTGGTALYAPVNVLLDAAHQAVVEDEAEQGRVRAPDGYHRQ